MIMPQKKTSQPPQFAAQDGVRSDLLKAIRDGKISVLKLAGIWSFYLLNLFRHCFEKGRTA